MILTEIKKYVYVLLFTAACGMIYNFLLPSGNISKSAKKVVSIVMLSAVCMPVFGVLELLDRGIPSGLFTEVHTDTESTVPYLFYIEAAKISVSDECSAIIKKYTNVPYKIDVSVNIRDDGSILIEYVRIIFEALPEGKSGMTEELKDLLGMMPDIRVESINE